MRQLVIATALVCLSYRACALNANIILQQRHQLSSGATLSSHAAALQTDSVPVLHFLFLAAGELPFLGLWRRFLSQSPQGSWRAWVHCSETGKCNQKVLRKQLPGLTVVSTKASVWCDDVVTPMVELLKNALADKTVPRGSPEHFAFLSDTTVPIKPFSVVYRTLIAQQEQSDLCFAPTSNWKDADIAGVRVALPKHSQWAVLSREHAASLVESWGPLADDGTWLMPLKGAAFTKAGLSSIDVGTDNGTINTVHCTDEFAIFAKLFGPYEVDDAPANGRTYPGIGTLTLKGPQASDTQGRCRTVLFFPPKKSEDATPRVQQLGTEGDRLLSALLQDSASNLTYEDKRSHPYTVQALGPSSLDALVASPFLFMRKVAVGATLPGYDGKVLDVLTGDGARKSAD